MLFWQVAGIMCECSGLDLLGTYHDDIMSASPLLHGCLMAETRVAFQASVASR